jgi:sugar phosphate isomerase/epimerase
MFKIKQSLDAGNYGAYFYEGRPLSMEEIIDRAVKFGYEGVDIWPNRPVCFPMDVNKERRKQILGYARSKGIKFAAVDACTNFMRTEHVLVPQLEKELLYVKACCELAQDLDCPVIRILPAFMGYFWPQYWDQGYGNIAMHSRSLEVSKLEDYIVEWEAVRAGVKEAGKIALDYGITVALQGHPPITNDNQDLFDLVDEVCMDNVKIGLDLSLFENQTPEFVRKTVLTAGKRMVHSHTLGIKKKSGPHGMIYSAEEVVPGDGIEDWLEFFKACKEIGYEGYFAYEQCAPFLMPGHKKPTIDEYDRRQKAGFDFLKSFEDKV